MAGSRDAIHGLVIKKRTVDAGLWVALQSSTFDVASDQGNAVHADSGARLLFGQSCRWSFE